MTFQELSNYSDKVMRETRELVELEKIKFISNKVSSHLTPAEQTRQHHQVHRQGI